MTPGDLAAVASAASSNDAVPGVLGFLVVAGIGVALVFLLRSMNKQFRKIAPQPDAGQDGDGGDGDGGEPSGAPAKTPAQTPELPREARSAFRARIVRPACYGAGTGVGARKT